jgi:hypothetical protein
MAITKDLLRALRVEIDAALAEVGKRHGVSLATGNASFTETQATFKLLVLAGEGKTTVDARKEKLAEALAYLKVYYPKLDTTVTYMDRGRAYKITGYNGRSRVAPIIITRDDGKTFKIAADTLQRWDTA